MEISRGQAPRRPRICAREYPRPGGALETLQPVALLGGMEHPRVKMLCALNGNKHYNEYGCEYKKHMYSVWLTQSISHPF